MNELFKLPGTLIPGAQPRTPAAPAGDDGAPEGAFEAELQREETNTPSAPTEQSSAETKETRPEPTPTEQARPRTKTEEERPLAEAPASPPVLEERPEDGALEVRIAATLPAFEPAGGGEAQAVEPPFGKDSSTSAFGAIAVTPVATKGAQQAALTKTDAGGEAFRTPGDTAAPAQGIPSSETATSAKGGVSDTQAKLPAEDSTGDLPAGEERLGSALEEARRLLADSRGAAQGFQTAARDANAAAGSHAPGSMNPGPEAKGESNAPSARTDAPIAFDGERAARAASESGDQAGRKQTTGEETSSDQPAFSKLEKTEADGLAKEGAGDAAGRSAVEAAATRVKIEGPAAPQQPAGTQGLQGTDVHAQVERSLAAMRGRLSLQRPELTLNLEPAELGRLQVRLEMHAGQLKAVIHAERQDVGNQLGADLPRLVAALHDAGVRPATVEVRTGFGNEEAPGGEGMPQQQAEGEQPGGHGAEERREPPSARTGISEHDIIMARRTGRRLGGVHRIDVTV